MKKEIVHIGKSHGKGHEMKDKILAIIKRTGPAVPNSVTKEVGADSIIVSSYLAELLREGKLKITKVKLGSSPFYFVPEDIRKTEPLYIHLKEKDQRTFQKLKEARVLQSDIVDPLTRVSLGNIKDFAVPMKINFQGNSYLFYRYFLVSQEEAIGVIKAKYLHVKPKVVQASQEEDKNVQANRTVIGNEIQKVEQHFEQSLKPENVVDENKSSHKKNEKSDLNTTQKPKEQQKTSSSDSQQTLSKIEIPDDDMMKTIKRKFDQKEITILSFDIIRKNSESEMMIKVPSQVGDMNFFVKAKFKKKINEGDLSAAYIGGQSKSLPVLFVTNGALTKKAKEMVEKEFKNNFTILEL